MHRKKTPHMSKLEGGHTKHWTTDSEKEKLCEYSTYKIFSKSKTYQIKKKKNHAF